MPGLREQRNCQIRMSSSLWNQIGEIARELGFQDARGGHSGLIRAIVEAAVAKWRHSPYVCRSAQHVVYVTKEGNIFFRQVQLLKLNTPREKLPCFIEMKPEKREYYHQRHVKTGAEPHQGFLHQWLLNYFSVWNGKKAADDIEAFRENPLDSYVDTFGTTSKSADLAVYAGGGRFLTREIVAGFRDYVQWKSPNTPNFDRFDIPIDIPTVGLDVCVIVNQEIFARLGVGDDEISNLALEFRNRESARFEGREVALFPDVGFEEQFGRSPDDDGADEMLSKVRSLRKRVFAILDSKTSGGTKVVDYADEPSIKSALDELPQHFLFYRLRWPEPHSGLEVCVRWEKPIQPEE